PNAGNVASVSWREDDAAPRQLAEAMARRSDGPRPRDREAATISARHAAAAELLAALPRTKHASARFLLKATARAVQTNEIGKATFLMAVDGGRAATRAIGAGLVAQGRLADRDDAFYLTADELRAVPADAQETVRFRRTRRDEHRRFELPLTFTGMPEPVHLDGQSDQTGDVITGVAGAPGEAKGRARVVLDPTTGESLEPGEILVCRFTDPSWAPLFTLADALVIDIGAAASHGAIVARELGVPCVIGTGDGTRRIHTGDLLLVDGSEGRVDVLERAVG
ncbi:MAG: peptidase, partial [Actinobacteria bacterium]|nr:peptidase [Actinomycetota bacterium]